MRTFFRHTDRGSVFVELVWTIPLFVAGVLLVALSGVYLNARSALQDGVTQALSLAATRGYSPQLSEELIPGVRKFTENPGTFPSIRHLLVSPQRAHLADGEILDLYKHATGDVELATLSPSQILALVYVNQALSMSTLGEAVYPCNPAAEEAGCLVCRFSDPSGDAVPGAFLDDVDELQGYGYKEEASARAQAQLLTMWCSYLPASRLLDTVRMLFGLLGVDISRALGKFEVKGRADAFPGM